MGRLILNRDSDQGVLSIVDGMMFAVLMVLATLLIFQVMGSPFTEERELRSSKIRREVVQDIQRTALISTIQDTVFTNESGPEDRNVIYENITVEEAIKEYHHFDHKEDIDEDLSYDLSRLENDIEDIYRKCALEVSKYNFAVISSYRESDLVLSNIQEIDGEEDLPNDRGASSSTLMIGEQQVDLTLHIWR